MGSDAVNIAGSAADRSSCLAHIYFLNMYGEGSGFGLRLYRFRGLDN